MLKGQKRLGFSLTQSAVEENERFAPLVEKIFRQINYLFSNFNTKNVVFTRFFMKLKCEGKIPFIQKFCQINNHN